MDIGLIGFGGVGKALIQVIHEKELFLKDNYNLEINIKYIIKSDGGIYSNEGIDLDILINYLKEGNDIQNHLLWDTELNIDKIIENKDIDTIVELTATNIINGQPGLNHIKLALQNSINVVTGNKGPILLAYRELKKIGDKNKVKLMVGCTTGGALPSITSGIYDLAGSEIKSIEGVLNGTSNFILSNMLENEIDYYQALKEAQELGIAESDPKLDVEGYDTAVKIIILSNVLLGTKLTLDDIEIEGITKINIDEFKKLRYENKKVKLIGKIENINSKIKGYVKPLIINSDHPLYSVDYKNKGVYFKTDILGDISIIGGASGTVNAAASILRDMLIINGLE